MSGGPSKILAIAEAWCGDVYRELPTVARIAEATGMSLRIFLRDENADIMDEFLSNGGKSRAIPVFVFYTEDLRYITHFTERSTGAHARIGDDLSQIKSRLNLPQSATYATLPDPDRQIFIREVIAAIQPLSEPGARNRSGKCGNFCPSRSRSEVSCPNTRYPLSTPFADATPASSCCGSGNRKAATGRAPGGTQPGRHG